MSEFDYDWEKASRLRARDARGVSEPDPWQDGYAQGVRDAKDSNLVSMVLCASCGFLAGSIINAIVSGMAHWLT